MIAIKVNVWGINIDISIDVKESVIKQKWIKKKRTFFVLPLAFQMSPALSNENEFLWCGFYMVILFAWKHLGNFYCAA